MKRGVALITVAALLGVSVPMAYASTVSSADSSASVWHVMSGDTLWKISMKTGVPVAQIAQTNGITNPNLLQVGQVLTIPTSSSGATQGTAVGTGAATYTVKAGDTLWKISQSTGVSMSNLQQANGLANPNVLTAGEVLTIPATLITPAGGGATSTTYTVQPGDMLWKIAQAHNVSIQTLIQANSLNDPNQLTVGEVLTMPTTSTTSASVGSVILTPTHYLGTNVNQSLQLSLTVKDTAGNTVTVPQGDVTYSITGTNSGTNPQYATIDPATERFTATQQGNYACVANVDGVQSQAVDIQVFGPPATLNVSAVSTLVTGSDTLVPLHFVVADAVGQPIIDTPVTITVSNPAIAGISLSDSGLMTSLPATVTTSSGEGSGLVWLRAGTGSGAADVVVTCEGLTQTVPITATTGPAKLTASVAQSAVSANTGFSDLVTIHAFNADGTPAVGDTLSPAPSNLMKVLGNSIVTNSEGVAQFMVYENSTSTGLASVGANTANAAAYVPIMVVPGVDSTQSTATLPNNFVPWQPLSVPVTVKDASGNPVLDLRQAAFDLHFQGTDGVYDTQGDASEVGDGQYLVTFFSSANDTSADMATMQNGNYLMSLLVNGVQVGHAQAVNVQNATYPAQTQPAQSPNLTLSFPQNLIANSAASSLYSLQIKVTNANGQPVANQSVSLSSNNTNVATPTVAYGSTGPTAMTDASGVARIGITPGFMPGTATITAVSGTSSQTITVQSVAEPTSILLTAPTSIVSSSGGSVTATAQVLSATGTPASNIALEVFSVDGNSSATMAPDWVLTNANGIATFQVTPSDFTSGNTLNVRVSDNNFITSNTLAFTLNGGTA